MRVSCVVAIGLVRFFGAQSGASSVVCVSEVCSSHDGTTMNRRKVYLPEAVGVANYDSSPMINNSGSL